MFINTFNTFNNVAVNTWFGSVSVYSRTVSGHPRPYYRITLSSGERQSGVSMAPVIRKVKAVPSDGRRFTRTELLAIIRRAVVLGVIAPRSSGGSPEVDSYVRAQLAWGTSGWQKDREAHRRPVTKGYMDGLLGAYLRHAAPHIPPGLTVAEATTAVMRRVQAGMIASGVSPVSVNQAMKALRTAFSWAAREGLVDHDPVSDVEPVSMDAKETIPLEPEEARAVLSHLKGKAQASGSWQDESAWLAVELAMRTGMRGGEIRALAPSSIVRLKDDGGKDLPYAVVFVKSNWEEPRHRRKLPKSGTVRETAVPWDLASRLLAHAGKNPHRDGFVFWGKVKGSPVSKAFLSGAFVDALDACGHDAGERKERRLVFHSLRHFYVTQARAVAPEVAETYRDIMLADGHASRRVEGLYTHATAKSLARLGAISGKIV